MNRRSEDLPAEDQKQHEEDSVARGRIPAARAGVMPINAEEEPDQHDDPESESELHRQSPEKSGAARCGQPLTRRRHMSRCWRLVTSPPSYRESYGSIAARSSSP